MSVKQINADQAREALEDGDNVVYIDVRTPPEFERGHPPSAINIPVVLPNPATGQMSPNPDFLKVVQAHVSKDRQVICGCQMGGRSQIAAELLDGAGYGDVANMRGGFGGARDPMGEIAVPGWLQMNYPVETDVNAENSYEGLKRKAQ